MGWMSTVRAGKPPGEVDGRKKTRNSQKNSARGVREMRRRPWRQVMIKEGLAWLEAMRTAAMPATGRP